MNAFLKVCRSVKNNGVLKTTKMCVKYFSGGQPDIRCVESQGSSYYVVAQDGISKSVIEGKTWEGHLNQIVTSILSPDANAIDLGANFGYHTIWMAKYLRNGKVFAFEPLSLTFSQLQMNAIANGLNNVFAYKFAVSDVTGQYVEMDKIHYGRHSLNIGNTGIGAGGDGTLTTRIDDLDLPKIDFMKIDIQGSEYRALLGMGKLIKRDRPIIFIEIEEHHLKRMYSSSKQVIEHLFSLGYVLLRLKTDYPCDHVAIPNERAATVEDQIRGSIPYPVDRLAGQSVELTFDNPANYSNYTVTP